MNRFRVWVLEDQPGQGLGGVPNNWRSTGYFDVERVSGEHQKHGKWGYSHEISAAFLNDAHEIGISEKWTEGDTISEGWKLMIPARCFRRIALWYLWRWAWGEWFGLRRKLFYWDLKRRVERQLQWAKKHHGD